MPKDDLVYLGHMLDTGRLVVNKIAGKSRSDFDADENLRLALTHLIQTFGESARRVSREFQERIRRFLGAISSECGTRWFTTTLRSITISSGAWQPSICRR